MSANLLLPVNDLDDATLEVRVPASPSYHPDAEEADAAAAEKAFSSTPPADEASLKKRPAVAQKQPKV
jgi:hypothetical protein